MKINILQNPKSLGVASAEKAYKKILETIENKGEAHIILATGTSQFETLQSLIGYDDIPWDKVTVFHLDEYIGLPITHPASFRKYLKERFSTQVKGLREFHYINGENDAQAECNRLNDIISKVSIDVALVGIGENGHLAFNDPPADFVTTEPYIVVELDEKCRKQQMGEGWFPTLEDVPKQAISMSIKQIMKSETIICSVPNERKAEAVKNCLENEVSNLYPASILQEHPSCFMFLDEDSASLMK